MKKALAIILSLLMLVGMFAGCTNTNDVDDGDDVGVDEKPVVELTLWCSETEAWQNLMKELVDEFIAANADKATITVNIGAQSEANAKDTVLSDIEAAADVFFFSDDQLTELVNAKALQPVNDVELISTANAAGAVDAASIDGTLYAYPATASNGYFVYYDKSVISEDQIDSFDGILEACNAAGKYFGFDGMSGWVSPFCFFTGYEVSLNADGTTNCNWNNEGGTDILAGMQALFTSEGIKLEASDESIAAMSAGDCAGFVNGTWNYSTLIDIFGDNLGCAKMPTFTVNGEQVQCGSMAGFKMAGVSAYSENVGWAMELAKFVTSEDAQARVFEAAGEGPANINAAASDAVAENLALAALSEQAAFATAQSKLVGNNYWSPAGTLHELAKGEIADLQAALDEAVAGITAPIA